MQMIFPSRSLLLVSVAVLVVLFYIIREAIFRNDPGSGDNLFDELSRDERQFSKINEIDDRKVDETPLDRATYQKCFEKTLTEPMWLKRKWLTTPEPCADHVTVLILIKSSLLRNGHRRFLRRSWAKKANFTFLGQKISIRTIYMVGTTPDPLQVNAALLREHRLYRDVLQLDVVDGYSTGKMVDKSLNGLQYASLHCPRVRMLVFGDDDTLIAPWVYFDLVQWRRLTAGDSLMYAGFSQFLPAVPRRGNPRFNLPVDVYPCSSVPPFLMAMSMTLSAETGRRFLNASRTVYSKYFLDDIYFTFLARMLDIDSIEYDRRYYDNSCLKRDTSHDNPHGLSFTNQLAVVHECDDLVRLKAMWMKLCDSNVIQRPDVIATQELYCDFV